MLVAEKDAGGFEFVLYKLLTVASVVGAVLTVVVQVPGPLQIGIAVFLGVAVPGWLYALHLQRTTARARERPEKTAVSARVMLGTLPKDRRRAHEVVLDPRVTYELYSKAEGGGSEFNIWVLRDRSSAEAFQNGHPPTDGELIARSVGEYRVKFLPSAGSFYFGFEDEMETWWVEVSLQITRVRVGTLGHKQTDFRVLPRLPV